MNTQADHTPEKKNQSAANNGSKAQSGNEGASIDNLRPEAAAQFQMKEVANGRAKAEAQLKANDPIQREKDTEKRVIDIIAATLSMKKAEVSPAASLTEDLGADELDVVELTMALEKEFEKDIPDGAINSVAAAIAAVKE